MARGTKAPIPRKCGQSFRTRDRRDRPIATLASGEPGAGRFDCAPGQARETLVAPQYYLSRGHGNSENIVRIKDTANSAARAARSTGASNDLPPIYRVDRCGTLAGYASALVY